MSDFELIAAASARAAIYDGDSRQDIKTDVANSFYAGSAFEKSRSGPQKDELAASQCAFDVWWHSHSDSWQSSVSPLQAAQLAWEESDARRSDIADDEFCRAYAEEWQAMISECMKRVKELEALLAIEMAESPVCVKCGDTIMAHDPGTCGNCHASVS